MNIAYMYSIRIALLVWSISTGVAVRASAPVSPCQGSPESCEAIATMLREMTKGPVEVKLNSAVSAKLPAGYGFMPAAKARKFLLEVGISASDRVVGVIIPDKAKGTWMMKLEYDGRGHVDGAEAREWTSADLLAAINKDDEARAANALRADGATIRVAGFAQEPSYYELRHRVDWALEAIRKVPGKPPTYLLNGYSVFLGRTGYLFASTINLQQKGDPDDILKVLNGLRFTPGHAYDDFRAGDPLSPLTLTNVVVGDKE